MTPNGRIKPDIVLVGGKEEKHSEGAYYLDWRTNGVRVRLSVGKNAQDALTQCQRKTFELNAISHGVEVVPGVGPNGHNGRKPLSVAIADFLEDKRLSKKPKTHSAYSTALSYFAESCAKLYAEDIDRRDMLKFCAFLRDVKEQAPRSVHNKFANVVGFLKSQGIHGLVGKDDWPRYVEEEPEVYEQAELDILFAACDTEERLWFEFFLMSGMREQEVMHTCWSDVNLVQHTVRVSHKPQFNWTPKAYKEREIPIPEKLVASLQAAKTLRDKACTLVFPTAGCRPKLDFLDCLKVCAERAKGEEGRLLASQVQGDVRNLAPVGWGRSAHGSTVARAFRHGKHDALPEAVPQSGYSR